MATSPRARPAMRPGVIQTGAETPVLSPSARATLSCAPREAAVILLELLGRAGASRRKSEAGSRGGKGAVACALGASACDRAACGSGALAAPAPAACGAAAGGGAAAGATPAAGADSAAGARPAAGGEAPLPAPVAS